jgi:hypothetical protein
MVELIVVEVEEGECTVFSTLAKMPLHRGRRCRSRRSGDVAEVVRRSGGWAVVPVDR